MPYRWRGAVDPPEEGEDAANAHLCRPAKVAAGDDVGDVVPEAVPAAAVRRRMEVFIVGGMPGTRYRLARMSKVLFPVVVDAARQSKQQ